MNFYLLAGGQSRRFGQNKALFVFAGKAIIERIIAAIPPAQKIFIVTNSPAAYAHLTLPTLPDHYLNRGPLAGIHAGLSHSSEEWNFFLACDFPCLQSSTIAEILAAPREAQVILPTIRGAWQPLCALWSKSALPIVETALRNHELQVRAVLKKMILYFVSPHDPETLFNLNTPEDLSKLQRPLA
jgi:molybdopterin-guanine dinucleotide biosynthesis protein A